ncbi:hypothetical protein N6H14_32180 [Paenibacillus sp. CC-CFT747]|nr:hypothetical protein N6H14_32180 [Paenibacillus sp. CC-CFT747]
MEFTPVTEVLPVPPVRWENAGDNELASRIYRILLRWLPFANEQFGEWDGRPECGHFFGGTSGTARIRLPSRSSMPLWPSWGIMTKE